MHAKKQVQITKTTPLILCLRECLSCLQSAFIREQREKAAAELKGWQGTRQQMGPVCGARPYLSQPHNLHTNFTAHGTNIISLRVFKTSCVVEAQCVTMENRWCRAFVENGNAQADNSADCLNTSKPRYSTRPPAEPRWLSNHLSPFHVTMSVMSAHD